MIRNHLLKVIAGPRVISEGPATGRDRIPVGVVALRRELVIGIVAKCFGVHSRKLRM